MRINLTAVVAAAGVLMIVAGIRVSDAAVNQIYESTRYTAKRGSSNLPDPQPKTLAECEARIAAAIAADANIRTSGGLTYQCISWKSYSVTFKANPLPPPPPIDCVVSAWGSWSDPPWLACVDGMQSRSIVRTRTIVTQPANGGTACPSLVETQAQTRACPGMASLSWTPPTQNTDGTALTNLAGYRIHYGTSPTALISTIQIANAGVSAYTVSGLAPGTYYFAVRAYSSAGSESVHSNVGSKVVQ